MEAAFPMRIDLLEAFGLASNVSAIQNLREYDKCMGGRRFHNADLSWEERDIIERYTRKGEIRVLCTTTTLAVGLNLPMKNAIVAPLCQSALKIDPP
jgi:replicative superfamily II helicase